MNCSHPQHCGFAPQILAGTLFALSWRVNAPRPKELSFSPATPLTRGKAPDATSIAPPPGGTVAEKSRFPLTVFGFALSLARVEGRGAAVGPCVTEGAATHVTSVHSMLGYEAWKHPCLGRGVRDMDSCQLARSAASLGEGCGVACARQLLELAVSIKLAVMETWKLVL